MRFELHDDPNGGAWYVVDDPQGTESGAPGDTEFTFWQSWGQWADGGVVGVLDTDGWSVEASFSNVVGAPGDEFEGLVQWTIYSADGTAIALRLETDRAARIEVVPSCVTDCAAPRDGRTDVIDLLEMLGAWGGSGGCDLDGDGVISVTDLLEMLGAWGDC